MILLSNIFAYKAKKKKSPDIRMKRVNPPVKYKNSKSAMPCICQGSYRSERPRQKMQQGKVVN